MKNKFRHLLTTVDLLNTLNGGVSEPHLSYRDRPDGREVRIRVPGVSKELLQVEINDNKLSVFYHIPMETEGKKVFLPKEVINQTLPYFVEIPGIHATFEENQLVVNLPYNELSNGYNRKVEIG
ncbi:MAG TPA: Hsp20/alpha crystallin family protein [Chryseosolibacter sp.]|nr:Hsp20/alpha crystallin family protein [Chryseosolibacter sp.]